MSQTVIELGGPGFQLETVAADFQAAGWTATYGQDTSDPAFLTLVTDAEGNSIKIGTGVDLVTTASEWLILKGADRATLLFANIFDGWFALVQWLGPRTLALLGGMCFFHKSEDQTRWIDHGDGIVTLECSPTAGQDRADAFNGEHNFQGGTGTLFLDIEPRDIPRRIAIIGTEDSAAYEISPGSGGLVTGLVPGTYELIIKGGDDYEYWRGQVDLVQGEVTYVTAVLSPSVNLVTLDVNVTPSPPLYDGHQITILQDGEIVAQVDTYHMRFVLPPGTYTVRSTLPDCIPNETTVALVDAPVTLPVDLGAAPGAFCVDTLGTFDWDEGVGYTIDIYEAGEKVGTLTAPYGRSGAVISLPRGYHEYDLELRYGHLRAPWAERTRIAVTIGPSLLVHDVTFRVPLTTFIISSELPDSVVWRTNSLGQHLSEVGPAPQQLTMGGHLFTGMASAKVYFTIEAPDYFPVQKLIQLTGNDYASDPGTGEETPVPHEITVEESDAEAQDATIHFTVTIDGQTIELWGISLDGTQLPAGVTMVARPAGTYLVTFHAPKPWFEDYSEELTVESGGTYSASHNFMTPQATFRIGDVHPATAEVWLDGQAVNGEAVVAVGNHDIKVTAPGYATAEGKITLSPGVYTFNFTMSELPEPTPGPGGDPIGGIIDWLTRDVGTKGPMYVALALGIALVVILLLIRR